MSTSASKFKILDVLVNKYGTTQLIKFLKMVHPHLSRPQARMNRKYLKYTRFGTPPTMAPPTAPPYSPVSSRIRWIPPSPPPKKKPMRKPRVGAEPERPVALAPWTTRDGYTSPHVSPRTQRRVLGSVVGRSPDFKYASVQSQLNATERASLKRASRNILGRDPSTGNTQDRLEQVAVRLHDEAPSFAKPERLSGIKRAREVSSSSSNTPSTVIASPWFG